MTRAQVPSESCAGLTRGAPRGAPSPTPSAATNAFCARLGKDDDRPLAPRGGVRSAPAPDDWSPSTIRPPHRPVETARSLGVACRAYQWEWVGREVNSLSARSLAPTDADPVRPKSRYFFSRAFRDSAPPVATRAARRPLPSAGGFGNGRRRLLHAAVQGERLDAPFPRPAGPFGTPSVHRPTRKKVTSSTPPHPKRRYARRVPASPGAKTRRRGA